MDPFLTVYHISQFGIGSNAFQLLYKFVVNCDQIIARLDVLAVLIIEPCAKIYPVSVDNMRTMIYS